jgi:hypothetical protein
LKVALPAISKFSTKIFLGAKIEISEWIKRMGLLRKGGG